MKLSANGRYAVLALLEIAVQESSKPISTKEIVSRQKISERYLEQTFAHLREAGLLISRRGAHGGYRLARQPHQINVADILLAAEGPLNITPCSQGAQDCDKAPSAFVTQALWQQAEQILQEYFGNLSLKELSALAKSQKTKARPTS